MWVQEHGHFLYPGVEAQAELLAAIGVVSRLTLVIYSGDKIAKGRPAGFDSTRGMPARI